MLKRSLAVLACVLLLVCCVSVTAFAAETSKASVAITANKETAKIGDTVTFTVSLVNAGAVEGGVWNYNVYVSVGAGLKIESASAGSGFDGMYFDVSGNQVHGSSFGATAGLTSGTTLGTITCTVTSDAGRTVSASVTSASLTEKVDGGLVTTIAAAGSDSVEIETPDEPTTPSEPEHTHTWGPWEVVKAPTCTAKGQEKRECTTCDAVETRDIAALGHSDKVYYKDLCEGQHKNEQKQHAVFCSVCDTELRKEDHQYNSADWVIDWPADAEAEKNGQRHVDCVYCAHRMTDVIEWERDPMPEDGDVTGQIILGTTVVMLMMAASAAFVFKRKTVR